MKLKPRKLVAPMLAVAAKIEQIPLPAFCTAKLDGQRLLTLFDPIKSCCAVSRTFKPIRNKHIREWIEKNLPHGLDCEIVTFHPDGRMKEYSDISGDVGRAAGKPIFKIFAFDYLEDEWALYRSYLDRMSDLRVLALGIKHEEFVSLTPTKCSTIKELELYERRCLEAGYEGIMTRTGSSPYKCGRSSLKQGWLLKLKRFQDDEAVVIGAEELMHNDNVKKADAFGHAKRSTHKANKRPSGMLGKLICRYKGRRIKLGSGYTKKQRIWIWKNRQKIIDEEWLCKFRFQVVGMKDRPRFPRWLGFRSREDL